jgi:hypothetical protein
MIACPRYSIMAMQSHCHTTRPIAATRLLLRTPELGSFWARSSGAAWPGYPDEVHLQAISADLCHKYARSHSVNGHWRSSNAR